MIACLSDLRPGIATRFKLELEKQLRPLWQADVSTEKKKIERDAEFLIMARAAVSRIGSRTDRNGNAGQSRMALGFECSEVERNASEDGLGVKTCGKADQVKQTLQPGRERTPPASSPALC